GGVWWIGYYRNGRRYEESANTDKERVARDLLKIREGDVAKGIPVSAKIGQLRFEDAAKDLITDYEVNGMRSIGVLKRRITLHLAPWFGGRRMATISSADVRASIAHRQAQRIVTRKAHHAKGPDGEWIEIPEETRPVSNAEINRELTTLKR